MKEIFAPMLASALLTVLASCWNSRPDSVATTSDSVTAAMPEAAPTDSSISAPPASSAAKDLGIPAGTAGVWVEDAARMDAEGADAEAAIMLCEGGNASYAVFSNQLFVFMKATRAARPDGDLFSFFYDGEDIGSGFRNAAIRHPASGALLGTGHVEGEGAGVLVMDWSAGEAYIASIRAAAPKEKGRTIFPPRFYHNLTAMAGLCEETE